jgi:hypothetical protein
MNNKPLWNNPAPVQLVSPHEYLWSRWKTWSVQRSDLLGSSKLLIRFFQAWQKAHPFSGKPTRSFFKHGQTRCLAFPNSIRRFSDPGGMPLFPESSIPEAIGGSIGSSRGTPLLPNEALQGRKSSKLVLGLLLERFSNQGRHSSRPFKKSKGFPSR